MKSMEYKPIGFFECQQKDPAESPRQGVLARRSVGVIQLNSDIPLESLRDLSGFSRLWLIYDFHFNKDWKPLVRPPRGSDSKRGVFATRSPYRPNPIGLSCVKMERLDGHSVFVAEHDLLNGTPILDIKPYIPYADSFPDATTGWLEDLKKYNVIFSATCQEKIKWLESQLKINFSEIIENQLEYEPTQNHSKRVCVLEDGNVYSYKTWRVQFFVEADTVVIRDVWSGYSAAELKDSMDLYSDKEIHRKFNEFFC